MKTQTQPTHTQGELIANSIMPFILQGIEPTKESREEVKKSIAKSIDHTIQKSLVGMIRLDEKTNKAVNMHAELLSKLKALYNYVNDNYNVRGDNILDIVKETIQDAEK